MTEILCSPCQQLGMCSIRREVVGRIKAGQSLERIEFDIPSAADCPQVDIEFERRMAAGSLNELAEPVKPDKPEKSVRSTTLPKKVEQVEPVELFVPLNPVKPVETVPASSINQVVFQFEESELPSNNPKRESSLKNPAKDRATLEASAGVSDKRVKEKSKRDRKSKKKNAVIDEAQVLFERKRNLVKAASESMRAELNRYKITSGKYKTIDEIMEDFGIVQERDVEIFYELILVRESMGSVFQVSPQDQEFFVSFEDVVNEDPLTIKQQQLLAEIYPSATDPYLKVPIATQQHLYHYLIDRIGKQWSIQINMPVLRQKWLNDADYEAM